MKLKSRMLSCHGFEQACLDTRLVSGPSDLPAHRDPSMCCLESCLKKVGRGDQLYKLKEHPLLLQLESRAGKKAADIQSPC